MRLDNKFQAFFISCLLIQILFLDCWFAMQLLWLRDSIVEGYVATVDTVREWLMIGVGVCSDLLLEAEMRANTDEHQCDFPLCPNIKPPLLLALALQDLLLFYRVPLSFHS